MASEEPPNRISIADASKLGLPALVREVEGGREQIILHISKPVAVIMSVERFERLQRLEDDLAELAQAASRMAITGKGRYALNDVLERLNFAREDLANLPDSDGSGQPSTTPSTARESSQWNDLANHPLIGRWRIVEMDLWDRDYLDLVEPAYIAFDTRGSGDFAFGAVTASLDCWYSPHTIEFTWVGSDEMDEVSGSGSAELEGDGTLIGDIRFHSGDESEFKAHRW